MIYEIRVMSYDSPRYHPIPYLFQLSSVFQLSHSRTSQLFFTSQLFSPLPTLALSHSRTLALPNCSPLFQLSHSRTLALPNCSSLPNCSPLFQLSHSRTLALTTLFPLNSDFSTRCEYTPIQVICL